MHCAGESEKSLDGAKMGLIFSICVQSLMAIGLQRETEKFDVFVTPGSELRQRIEVHSLLSPCIHCESNKTNDIFRS